MQITPPEWNNTVENAEDDACRYTVSYPQLAAPLHLPPMYIPSSSIYFPNFLHLSPLCAGAEKNLRDRSTFRSRVEREELDGRGGGQVNSRLRRQH